MTPTTQVVCSCALTFGAPIAAGLWELWHLGISKRRLPPGEDLPPEPTPLPNPGACPRIQRPLPECLVPRPLPVKVRELA